jgi:hypothetical protein
MKKANSTSTSLTSTKVMTDLTMLMLSFGLMTPACMQCDVAAWRQPTGHLSRSRVAFINPANH